MGRINMPKRSRVARNTTKTTTNKSTKGSNLPDKKPKPKNSNSSKGSSKNLKDISIDIKTPATNEMLKKKFKRDESCISNPFTPPTFNNDIIDELALSIKRSLKKSYAASLEVASETNTPTTLDDILSSNKRKTTRSNARNKTPDATSPSLGSNKTEAIDTPTASNKKRFQMVDIPIESLKLANTKSLPAYDGSLDIPDILTNKLKSEIDDWVKRIKATRSSIKNPSRVSKEYTKLQSTAKNSGLLEVELIKKFSPTLKRKGISTSNGNQGDQSTTWKTRYEKLHNLRVTEAEKKYEKLVKQVEIYLKAADDKVDQQQQHINNLTGELQRVTQLISENENNKITETIKSDERAIKEKDLEDKVLMLTEQLIQSKAAVSSMQKQRRLSSTSIDSVVREKVQLFEGLSGFKILDITNDSEGNYYLCQLSGNYGKLEFFLSVFDDDDNTFEYMPNFDGLSQEQVAELTKYIPSYMKEPFVFEKTSSYLFFWRICDALNRPRE